MWTKVYQFLGLGLGLGLGNKIVKVIIRANHLEKVCLEFIRLMTYVTFLLG